MGAKALGVEIRKAPIVSWRAIIIGIAICAVVNTIFGATISYSVNTIPWQDWIIGWPSRDFGVFNTPFWYAVAMILIVSLILAVVNMVGKKPLLNRSEVIIILFMTGYSFALLGMFQSPIAGYMSQGIAANVWIYNKGVSNQLFL